MEDGIVKGDAHSWNTIREQLHRLDRLSRDVRNVSHSYEQPLSNQIIVADPALIARSAIAAWQTQFEKKGVELTLRYDNPVPSIEVDPLRIGQVLSNLLENALRHSAKNGLVELIIDQVNGGVSFTIRDNGEGIPENQLPHIFDRLYRGDSSRQSADTGSGLGLTIARSIAENHAGTLIAKSKGRGKGATFILTLPCFEEFSGPASSHL
jgi:signal transduction histidine kinase